jgi:hypothetical protein
VRSAFDLRVPREVCNPRFLLVCDQQAHRSTRLIIDDLFSTFHDKDGEFVKRFQTTEFESRLWELYLHACLQEAQAELNHSVNGRIDIVAFCRIGVARKSADSRGDIAKVGRDSRRSTT